MADNIYAQYATPQAPGMPAPATTSVPPGNIYSQYAGGPAPQPPRPGSQDFTSLYAKHGQATNIDPLVLHALALTENDTEDPTRPGPVIQFGPDKGTSAVGLMQVTDSTSKDFGGGDLTNPDINIGIGARTLRRALNKAGNYKDALQAYSGGAGDVYYNRFLANYTRLGGDPSKLAYTPDNLGYTAAGAAEALMPPNQAPQGFPTRMAAITRHSGPLPARDPVAEAIGNAAVGAAHNGLDVPVNSLQEAATYVSDALGLTKGAYDQTQAAVNQFEQNYAGTNAASSGAGRFGSFLGGIGTATALTPELGALRALGWGAKAAGEGALGGGVYGATQSSASPNPLAQDVLTNMLVGGVGGPVLAGTTRLLSRYLARPAAEAAAPTIRGAEPVVPTTPVGRVEPQLGPATALQPRAVSPAELQQVAQGVQQSAAREPSAASAPAAPAAAPPVVGAAERARQAAFSALGAQPTAGMLGRNPARYTAEQNLAKMQAQGSGGEMLARMQDINDRLQQAAENIKAGTGARATTEYAAGQKVLTAIEQKSEETQAAVGKLYTGVRNAVGDNFGARPDGLMSALDKASDIAAADPITISVQRRLARLGIQSPTDAWQLARNVQPRQALSVNESEELRKFMVSLPAKDRTTKWVKGQLIRALDSDVIDGAGIDAFKQARDAAEARFSEFERRTMHDLAEGKTEPEKVLRNLVFSGDVADLKALKKSLLTGNAEQIARGTEAWNEVRGQAADHLIAAGFGDGTGQFMPKSFENAIKKLSPERLNLLFGPEELAAISNIRIAGSAAFKAPPLSAVNYPNSGIFAVHEGTKLAEKFAKGVETTEKMAGPLLEVLPGGGLATRAARHGAAFVKRVAERSAEKASLNPNIEAEIAARARQEARGAMQQWLSKLPMSNAAVAAYQQNQ